MCPVGVLAEVHLDAPESVSQGTSPVIQARLSSTGPIRIREMRFFWRHEGGEFDRLAMMVETTSLGITGRIVPPLTAFQPGSWMEYFIVIESDQGEDFVSEMQRLRITQ